MDGSFRPEYHDFMRGNCSRGIYLVANRNSSAHCHNLIYSIRQCGCKLPIRILPYGGEPLRLKGSFEDVGLVHPNDFSAEARAFVAELSRRMRCSPGLLQRFLCWFGEFDEFLYSDNDIVALMNWEELFPFLDNYELVHADLEYLTEGVFNAQRPKRFEELLGPGALEQAITCGHFLCRPSPRHTADLLAALSWMEANPEVPKWHDQAILHVTVILGRWRVLNLCKPPHNWASSWAGDYKSSFDVLRTITSGHKRMSHIHYSGVIASGTAPVDELLFASLPVAKRNRQLLRALLYEASGVSAATHLLRRVRNKIKRMCSGES